MWDIMPAIQRDKYWDVVKGLGILTVVFGHSGFSNLMILYIINYFHLAIFFFVSGFLFNDKHSGDPIHFAGRKLRDIWWPTMKYVIVFIWLHNIFLKLNVYSTVIDQPMISTKLEYSLYDFITKPFEALLNSMYSVELAGAMWFIFPLIVAMVVFCIIRYIAQLLLMRGSKKEIFSFVIAAVLGVAGVYLVINSIKLAWRADIALLVMPIIYLGYLVKLYWTKVPISVIGAVLSIITLYVCYINGLEISYAAGIIGNPVLYYIATFSGIYLVLFVAKIINKMNYLSKIIAHLGEKSFHIMALHFLAFKVVNYFDVMINGKESFMIAQFPSSNWDWWYLYLFVGLVVPVLGVYIFGKIEGKLKLIYNNYQIRQCEMQE